MEAIARSYITYARQLSFHGRYSKAFKLYILAFDKCPTMKSLFEAEFRVVLIRLNEKLARFGKVKLIFSNFGKAVEAFPANMNLLNDIGKYLFKFGYYTVAWSHFQKALKVDSGFVDAEKNLNSVKNFLVERWHFRMLNDHIRNDAYHEAILETVIPGRDRILDLGTGTGLLALYANECTPLATTGCDGSEVMAKIAEDIVNENHVQGVDIINDMSTNLNCKDIGGRQTLLITELFDCSLLGEHILQSLSHAWDNLMTSTGRVIPYRAEFFVVAVNCNHLNIKYQLQQSAKVLLNVPNLTVHTLTYGETYDCEDVHLFKDIQYMTEVQSLLQINFNDYEDIQRMLQTCEPSDVKLTVKECGEINIIVGWFNLYLTEKVMISTNPMANNRANAWQQAVFLDFVPRHVKKNEIVKLQFQVNGGKLAFVPDSDVQIDRISPETLRFLNDSDYTKKIKDCIGIACVYLGQIMEISQVTIADMCPFPLFGLLMMKRRAKSLICFAKSQSDKKFFKKVFKANNIPLSQIKILVGDEFTQRSFGTAKYHAIICNSFELCGDLDLHQREISYHLKHHHLHHEGLFLPAQVHMMGQLVNSQWLDINNRVYDENVHNYKIAMHMNKFQVSQNYCLDFGNLDSLELSAPTVLGTFHSKLESSIIRVPIVNDGNANAVLCWYSIELIKDLEEVQTNRYDSFINGMAFLAHPNIPVVCSGFANVLRCVDRNGSFKLIIDVDTR